MNSHWIPDKLDIIWQYITYIFFSILDVASAISFLCYFKKLQLLLVKKIQCTSICMYTKRKCLIFFKPYFRLEILIFLSFVASFLVDQFD